VAATVITPIPGVCPAAIIVQSGEYQLAGDVGPCPPGVDGIQILASSVGLHLKGHTVSAMPPCNFSHAGIRVGSPTPAPMLSNVRIIGAGTIRDFGFGVVAQNSAGSSAKFLTVTCSGAANSLAILGPGGQWKLEGNVVQQGPPTNFCSIAMAVSANDNDIVRNDVNSPICLLSNNNTLVNNTSNGSQAGIFAFNSSQNNEIHANTTNNNSGVNGITISSGSTGNNITGNKSFGNLPFDMADNNPACDSNKWQGNHFDSASQPCIQ
jgi:hypothetical protein